MSGNGIRAAETYAAEAEMSAGRRARDLNELAARLREGMALPLADALEEVAKQLRRDSGALTMLAHKINEDFDQVMAEATEELVDKVVRRILDDHLDTVAHLVVEQLSDEHLDGLARLLVQRILHPA